MIETPDEPNPHAARDLIAAPDVTPEPDVITEPETLSPSGLGGWLALVGLGLVISPLRLGGILILTFPPMFQDGTWAILTTPGNEAYHPLWGPLILFEIAVNTTLLLTVGLLLWLFFTKSLYFPKAFIGFTAVNVLFIVSDTWLVSLVLPDQPMLDPETGRELFRAFIGAAIWIPYMLTSKRVDNTFVK